MAKASMTDLKSFGVPGTTFAIRVTPKAAKNDVFVRDGVLRVNVTTVPEAGKANAVVLKVLAKAIGVPKSRLSVARGATGRDKVIAVAG